MGIHDEKESNSCEKTSSLERDDESNGKFQGFKGDTFVSNSVSANVENSCVKEEVTRKESPYNPRQHHLLKYSKSNYFESDEGREQNVNQSLKEKDQKGLNDYSVDKQIEERPAWDVIQLNLEEICRLAYGTGYLTCLRISIHANCRIRRVFFAREPYSNLESELTSIDYNLEENSDHIHCGTSRNPNQCVKTFGELQTLNLPFEFQLYARLSKQERKEYKDKKRKKAHG